MIFSVQRYLEEYFNNRGLSDPDQYAVLLAKLYDRERSSKTVTEFLSAMKRIRTVFFRRNANLERDKFNRNILTLLDSKFKKKECSSSLERSQQGLKLREIA
jgi:chemotaxis methyl-accepting protein methylase